MLLVGLALMLAVVLTACNTAGGLPTVTVTNSGTINWEAYQDGTGAWQQLTGASFTVSDSAGKYGVAWECPSPATHGPGVGVIQATTAESTAVLAACPPGPVTNFYTVSGTISGIPSGGTAFISIGAGSTTATSASPTFTLGGIASGTHTIVAYGLDSGGNASRMVVNRNVSITANNSSYNVDLSSGQLFTMNTLHLTNISDLSTTSLSAYLVSTGLGANPLAISSGSTDVTYPVLPGSLAQSSDLYGLYGHENPASTIEYVELLTRNPSNGQSIALPTAITPDAKIAVSGSTTTVTWGTTSFSGSGGLTVHSATDDFTSNGNPSWIVAVTDGWKGSTTTYTFPDFSSTAGWNTAWNPPSGVSGDFVDVHALHANLSLEQLEIYYLDGASTIDPNGTQVQNTENQ